ncbi:hypothetical protein CVU75_02785 [Candidatus Dependentiae bacterium HGW-Dependentiae-1]|nr:MAG: hypothetical protein CVU75_02785 [Candidatus Dependentiae bacterium HGW-Dependentiae-1]
MECAAVIDGFKRFRSLAFSLGLDGFMQEGFEKGMVGFSLWSALKKSVWRPVHIHSLKSYVYTPEISRSQADGVGVSIFQKALALVAVGMGMALHDRERVTPLQEGDDCVPGQMASDTSLSVVKSEKFGTNYIWTAGTAGDVYRHCGGKKGASIPRVATAAIGTAAFVAIQDYGLFCSWRDSVKALRDFITSTNKLQSHMVTVAQFFKAVDELHALLEKKGCLATFKSVRLSQKRAHSDKRKELELLLKSGTFLKEYTTLYSRGRVLLAHKRMQEVKEELVPTLQLVGELDAYCSLARLYKERIHTQSPFCFAHYVSSPRASIEVTDCWIPVVPEAQSVVNTISWGTAQAPANKIIITGPNGCGKSTVMKVAAWAALLGQSWGIVPACTAHMSLFGCIKTSLNPQENLQKGLSTFMAEKYRMDAIANFLTGWAGKGPVLLLLDEPYHGTVGLEASDRIVQFGVQLANNPWCMLVMATHLEPVTQLPEKTNGAFANYCLDVARSSAGIFKRTFKLQSGVAHWWFADQTQRRQFIDQLVAQ